MKRLRLNLRPGARSQGQTLPFGILATAIVILALLPLLGGYSIDTGNVYDIFQNFASYGLVALALGVTIIAGEFDLSVSSMYLLGGMVAVLTGTHSPILGIAAAIGVAIVVGAIQGSLIARFRLNSMPVTLGGYLTVLGVTYLLGNGNSVAYSNYNVGIQLDNPVLTIFSIHSLVSIGAFVLAALVLRYLRVGRDIRAIGGDRRSARTAGVRVDRLLVGVFVLSAIGAALPGALLSYSLATASPTNISFDVLTFSATAALLGGVSLSGGRGSVVGIAAGVLSLSVLQEILAIVNSPDYVQSLITGGLLLLVTIVWAPELSQWFKTAGSGRLRSQPSAAPENASD
jgi:ribose/xylose/arabinose/galactoside ABC-type transport system permease subunit